jgi:hypothetical protein
MTTAGASSIRKPEFFSVWLRIPDDGPGPENDPDPKVEEIDVEIEVWGEDEQAKVSNSTTLNVHNVDPTFIDPYSDPEDPEYLIDIYDYPPGGPDFVVSGVFYDPGSLDTHVITIDWGDGTAPTVFVPINYSVAATHRYAPDGLDHTITVTVVDDDTGIGTYTEEISMYLLDLDNDADNNGAINEADDPIEHVPPGAFVGVNADDDNENGVLDMLDLGTVSGENDLEEFHLRWQPADRPYAPVNNYIGWHVVLTMFPGPDTYTGEPPAKIYLSEDKGTPLALANTPAGYLVSWIVGTSTPPSMLYLEALIPTQIDLSLKLCPPTSQPEDPGTPVDEDLVVFTAIPPAFEILTIHHGQGGRPVPDIDEYDIGAFTVANINDTDGDGFTDAWDGVVQAYTDTQGKQRGIDEVDLMRLIVKRPPGYVADTHVTIVADPSQVRFWGSETKGGDPYELDPFGTLTLSFETGQTFRELWVEAIAVSTAVRDITITAQYGTSHDTVRATAVWAAKVAHNSDTTNNIDELNAVLAMEPWKNMPDGSSIPQLLRAIYKGFGIRPLSEVYGVANVIIQAWQPLPEGILDEPGAKFDITRRADDMRFDRITVDFVQFHEVVMPDMLDMVNDDGKTTDEDGPYGGLLFVFDTPGRAGVATEPVTSRADRHNFEEFIRVKVGGGQKPAGNGLVGSRASTKFYWHSRSQITKTGTAPNRVASRVPAFDDIGEFSDYTTIPH